jgi:hypothetical protein
VARFNSRATHRAYIADPYKILQVEGVGQQFFNLKSDPFEMQDLSDRDPAYGAAAKSFEAYLENVLERRPANLKQADVSVASEQVTQRLRGLGYLD